MIGVPIMLNEAIDFALETLRDEENFVPAGALSRKQIKNLLNIKPDFEGKLTAMLDTTRLQSGKEGYVIADRRLYWGDRFEYCFDLNNIAYVRMETDNRIAVRPQEGTFTYIYCPKYRKRLLRFLFVLLDYPNFYGLYEATLPLQYSLKLRAQRSFCENLRYYCLMHPGFKARAEMDRKDEKILRAVFPSIDTSKVVAYRINPLRTREEDGVDKRCRGPYAHSVIAFTNCKYYYDNDIVIDIQPLDHVGCIYHQMKSGLRCGYLQRAGETPFYFSFTVEDGDMLEQIFEGICQHVCAQVDYIPYGIEDLTEEKALNMRRNYEIMRDIYDSKKNPYRKYSRDQLVQMAREREARGEYDELPALYYAIAYKTPQNENWYYYMRSLYYYPLTWYSLIKMDYYRALKDSWEVFDRYLSEEDYRRDPYEKEIIHFGQRDQAYIFFKESLIKACCIGKERKMPEVDLYDIRNQFIDLLNDACSYHGDKRLPRLKRPKDPVRAANYYEVL